MLQAWLGLWGATAMFGPERCLRANTAGQQVQQRPLLPRACLSLRDHVGSTHLVPSRRVVQFGHRATRHEATA
eukprot:2789498-Alexandrium_andersonii.AAC.1